MRAHCNGPRCTQVTRLGVLNKHRFLLQAMLPIAYTLSNVRLTVNLWECIAS
ncbi:hypothetical protein HBI56_040890 [Parastagonospora nodorum]|uniref:Uncharacterized protein n=1 Tax=Phaeosphaeria nodorum (strain SN15 / ATCC MYA-4574 / FGSC 10173) TaxID=321614 RepID=A0A7U2EWP7_PHANO|nr:hypothetical protein HBH56_065870 [Parastagonospora nodorum]QRC93303.1 hypothetical protein JI435_403580 [Parastagonospora nodorum SN15]KAH3932554.1 hypothetical protein HBH54_082220 [Parastagonospora nodorum]KAH3955187.1 hypothetical protein HBH53_012170 [Parastagonospora nodorum]KAH3986066.1 hypothetical protein HBH52_043370 [Parastagonospora nodorum]